MTTTLKVALTIALVLAALILAGGSYAACLTWPVWAATVYVVFAVRAGVALGEAMGSLWIR
jgi:hypothetical protein